MFRLSWLLSLMSVMGAHAQWVHVPINVPLGMGMFGPGSVGQILMVAPGVGYCTTSVYYSPSSGSGQAYWFTDSDWTDHSPMGTAVNRTLHHLKARGTRALFSSWYDQLSQLNSLLCEQDGSAYWYDYPFFSHTSMAMAPIGDTVCLLSTFHSAQHVIVRTTPNESEVLDTITCDWSSSVDMVFRDSVNGALLLHGYYPGSAILVTQDGGHSWFQAWSDTLRMARAMAWGGEQTLWAVGDSGLVIGTHDGGATWNEVVVPSVSDLRAVATCGEDCIWVGGAGGVILATGDPQTSWTLHSLPAIPVKDLFAFEGVVYASSGGDLYKLPMVDHGLLRAGTANWWAFSEDGVRLLLDEDETPLELVLYDGLGRAITTLKTQGEVILRGLSTGLYILDLSTTKRKERGKVFWLPIDR